MEKIKNKCRSCNQTTNHYILQKKKITEEGGFPVSFLLSTSEYFMLECCGCENISFRIEYTDFGIANYEPDYEPSVEIYPSLNKHQGLGNAGFQNPVPQQVNIIYQEALKAYNANLNLLAGLGFRATIEAIVIDLKIKDNTDLSVKIDKLKVRGFVSQKEADMLHAVRFLGNDVAHVIKKPENHQLEVVLEIVEQLLKSVYILPKKAKGKLKTIISDYDEFIQLLKKELANFNHEDELPLNKILGKEITERLQGYGSEFEKKLITDIQNGSVIFLKVGKFENNDSGSKGKIQHFIVP